MGIIKINVEDGVERSFREIAMKKFGYSKGSLSTAAEDAFIYWLNKEADIQEIRSNVGRNPVESMRGILKHVKKTSVELQEDLGKIWSEEAVK
ncbi:hypothetical protein A3K63_04495 [Candidatus Micrarchaeota archaeon RBG_16_49_10]|nr:MAG: hypothetical protein A3K63_04495 [Candidatus Micrarchaeota archaeon RBG_16_49_10]